MKIRFSAGKIRSRIQEYRDWQSYWRWLRAGKPIPPPEVVKQMTVREYGRKFGIRTFVETGTYLGYMVGAVRTDFERIYSIELSEQLYQDATRKFYGDERIVIMQGDSGTVLPALLEDIDEPCLFWLDAHYSAGVTARGEKETPIVKELSCILDHEIKGHVMLIDDARHFTGEDDYPAMQELRDFVSERCGKYVFEVREDIIRLHDISHGPVPCE